MSVHAETDGKMKTQQKFEDERVQITQRISDLETELNDVIQKHIDFMYTRERTHNMECQYIRRQIPDRVAKVAEERGEAERIRMIGVRRRAMLDSAQLYHDLASTIGSSLTDLMRKRRQLDDSARERVHVTGAIETTTAMTTAKNIQQQELMSTLAETIRSLEAKLAEFKELYFIQMNEREQAGQEYVALMNEIDENNQKIAALNESTGLMEQELKRNTEALKRTCRNNAHMVFALTSALPMLRDMLNSNGFPEVVPDVEEALKEAEASIDQELMAGECPFRAPMILKPPYHSQEDDTMDKLVLDSLVPKVEVDTRLAQLCRQLNEMPKC